MRADLPAYKQSDLHPATVGCPKECDICETRIPKYKTHYAPFKFRGRIDRICRSCYLKLQQGDIKQ